MADELRWENLNPANTALDVDSAAEFRNDSSVDIHIREIGWNHLLRIAENDESAIEELGKSPSIQSGVASGVFFMLAVSLGIQSSTTGAAQDDGTVTENGNRKYAKGQLTLEPGEFLFANQNVIAGAGTQEVHWSIGYHFD